MTTTTTLLGCIWVTLTLTKGHNESMLWTRLLTSQSLSPIYRPLPMLVTPRKEKLTFLAALSG